jgi:hypothetical protein
MRKTDKNSKTFQKNGLPAIFLKCPTNVEGKYAIFKALSD